ncbi:hypothetical protein [Microbacterium sp. 77mftsu3.1]|uniref:hypothetical protein n=1 Tax=Microbacterium sp. 77mftsu3.1 TaxID=1761802 RepID=UPI00036C6CC5|nr:hypothetical protein [Microbacterium sp. 77mftsu3.1]SDG22505.1 hypothetical protein SAMN04488590_0240 [Microbacterium sp. 77mftsu3.1]
MTIPLDAIHPEINFHAWERSFEHHLGQIPDVLSMLVTLAQPRIGVSRGGSAFDRLQITGGNDHRDLSDTIDDAMSRDAEHLWGLLAGYAATVWEQAEQTREDAPTLPTGALSTATTARDTALVTVGWLIGHAATIYTLDEFELDVEELFRTVRRLKTVHGIHPHPRRERCDTCGKWKVENDYTDLADGTVARVGVCRGCGQTYLNGEPTDT